MRNVGWTILVIGALLSVFFAGRLSTRGGDAAVRDTITIYDTMRYTAPRLTASNIIRYDVRSLPRLAMMPPMPSVHLRDSVTIVDTVPVYLPVERVEYQTEQYYAIVEGYDPKLVQLDIYNATKVITETITKRKRWGVSVGIQGGYGITPKGMQPYAGVGVTVGYNF
ncbi:MAG: hypothetical protein J6J64_03645 [Alistipes sp.]|nr:hypothetical protein [Alistipes sp.]